jgi:hypothetical protein
MKFDEMPESEIFEDNAEFIRKIYIGPMSRKEMIEHYPEFRHNFTDRPPLEKVEQKNVCYRAETKGDAK